ncbi:MAG TPA: hypothetical protein VM198_02865 [Longimicrobiales bacterium]|nr:hypothetical protein [Longimicrobiales bacterium]
MDLVGNFLVELTAGLVGVFAGAILALWADRQARARRAADAEAELQEHLAQSRKLVISSVVKNTSEAKRLRAALASNDDPYLFQVGFELAVWEATQAQFVQIASLDERVLLTRFFDQVRRLTKLIDFHRQVRAELEIRQIGLDAGDRALLDDLLSRLRAVADDIRIDGLVVVSDLGDPMHKRLLGMHEPAASITAA